MKLILIIFFLYSVLSCSGAEFLLGGEQIGALWDGKYKEDISGSAYLNVGNKQVDIRNIDIIPSFIYSVDTVMEQETELTAWLKHEGQFLPMKMTRKNLNERATTVFFNAPQPKKGDFPTIFDTNITMTRL